MTMKWSGNESDMRWGNMDLHWDGNEEGLAEVKWSLCCDIATAAASSLCVQFLTRSWHCFEAKHFHFLFLQISVSFIRFKHYCYVRRWPLAELSITTVCTTGARNVLISISSSSHWNESHDIIIVLSCSCRGEGQAYVVHSFNTKHLHLTIKKVCFTLHECTILLSPTSIHCVIFKSCYLCKAALS